VADKKQDKKEKKEKKERVIHTRVSEKLERELRENATQLGVSVSNLVRNVLLNTFGLVEGLVMDGAKVAHSAKGEKRTDEVDGNAGAVIGWHEVVLNRNALCDTCNDILPRGKTGYVAVTEGSGKKPVICTACLDSLKKDATKQNPKDA
jgi:hypothetical protein